MNSCRYPTDICLPNDTGWMSPGTGRVNVGAVSELVRGLISDRPWGLTFGQFVVREVTGQLTVNAADGRLYRIAFDRGAIVGASSPQPADSAIRVALTSNLIMSSQVSRITNELTARPGDDVAVVASVCRLDAAQTLKLRRNTVAQRAARTFSIEQGVFVLDDEITIPTLSEGSVDPRAVIYQGARMNLSEARLVEELRGLGSHFTLGDGFDAEERFGLAVADRPILDALRAGTTIAELEARHRDLDPRNVQSVIYALVACREVSVAGDGAEVPAPGSTAPVVAAESRPQRASTAPTESRPQRASTAPVVATESRPQRASTAPVVATGSRPQMSPVRRTALPSTAPQNVPAEPSSAALPEMPIVRIKAPSSAPQTTSPAVARTTSGGPPAAQTATPAVSRAATPPSVTRTTSGTGPNVARTISGTGPAVARTTSGGRTAAGSNPPTTARIPSSDPAVARTRSGSNPPASIPAVARTVSQSGSQVALPRTISQSAGVPVGRDYSEGSDRVRASLAEADNAFILGQEALRNGELVDAIAHLTRAANLNPHEFDHTAILAWAQFLAAPPTERTKSSDKVRKLLNHAIQKSRDPESARFHLGQLEKELGHDGEALALFKVVLKAKPDHPQAQGEVDELEAKAPGKSGWFRKR